MTVLSTRNHESSSALTTSRSPVAARATASTAAAAAAASISATTTATAIAVALVATATATAAFGHQVHAGAHGVWLAARRAGHAGFAGEAGHPVLPHARTRCVGVV